MRALDKLFGLYHLKHVDVINTGQRRKIGGYNNQFFIMDMLIYFKCKNWL